MTQKQTTYSDDIKSAFEDKVSYKQAKKIAEDMKNLQ